MITGKNTEEYSSSLSESTSPSTFKYGSECVLFKKEGLKSGIELWKEKVGWCATHDAKWNKAIFKHCVKGRPILI